MKWAWAAICLCSCGRRDDVQRLYREAQPYTHAFLEADAWIRQACAAESGFVNEATWLESAWMPLRHNKHAVGGMIQSGFRTQRHWIYSDAEVDQNRSQQVLEASWGPDALTKLTWASLRLRADEGVRSVYVASLRHMYCGESPCIIFSRKGVDESGRSTRVVIAYRQKLP